MRSIRIATVLATLALAGAVVAPSVGAFDELKSTGNTGLYTVPDYNDAPGAVCRYEQNQGPATDEIDKVGSKRVWTHGPFSQKSWVGHRVIFLKNAKPWGDDSFRVVHKSPIVKKRANDTDVAFFGGNNYRTPEANKSEYRVQHIFTYYKKGSTTKVIGRVQGVLEVYRMKIPGEAGDQVGVEGGPVGRCPGELLPVA